MPGATQRQTGSVSAVGALADRQRPVHEPDHLVAELDEVAGGQLAAPHIVNGDRAQVQAAGVPVEQHGRDAAPRQRGNGLQVAFDRSDEQAVNPVLFEHPEVAVLALGRLVAGADHEHVPLVAQDPLCASHHLTEEGVGYVQQDNADGAALPHPQLVGGRAAHEARLFRLRRGPARASSGPPPTGY